MSTVLHYDYDWFIWDAAGPLCCRCEKCALVLNGPPWWLLVLPVCLGHMLSHLLRVIGLLWRLCALARCLLHVRVIWGFGTTLCTVSLLVSQVFYIQGALLECIKERFHQHGRIKRYFFEVQNLAIITKSDFCTFSVFSWQKKMQHRMPLGLADFSP